MAESTLLLDRLKEVVKEFHKQGLYLFTYGEVNNVLENYKAQKGYGLDGIILDDVARVTKVLPETPQTSKSFWFPVVRRGSLMPKGSVPGYFCLSTILTHACRARMHLS